MKALATVLLGLAMAATWLGSVNAQETGLGLEEEHGLQIQYLMPYSEFRWYGLNKLSAEELARLNKWIQQYKSTDAIESRIPGHFTGWDGETEFRLENGQVWRQTDNSFAYVNLSDPFVVIYKIKGEFKMKVDCVPKPVFVKRVK